MARVMIYVCDECGTQEGVKRYEIREDGRRVSVDLCSAHSQPLEAFLSKVETTTRTRRTTRTRLPKVTTMEEIEALKTKS